MEKRIRTAENPFGATEKEIQEMNQFIEGVLKDKRTVLEAAADISQETQIEFRKLGKVRNLIFSLVFVGWLSLSKI